MNILVVEDKYECALTAKEALSSKGNVINSYDLEDALNEIKHNQPGVVLTDMCFQEKGINSKIQKKEGNLIYISPYFNKKFQIEENEKYMLTLEKGTKEENTFENSNDINIFYRGINSEGKLKELESIALETESISDLMRFVWGKYDLNSEEMFEEEMRGGIKFSPPMGYYIFKESQKKNLPVVIITNTSHAGYTLPVISWLGIEEFFRVGREYIRREKSNDNNSFLKSGKVIFSDKINSEDWILAFNQALKQKK